MAPRSRCRFGRSQRLLGRADFQRVFDQPRRFSSSAITILARANGTETARLGLVISKKCDKRAVARNRIKRLIRESFRVNSEPLCGLDVVVIGRRELVTKTNQQIFSELNKHWTRLARCKPSF